MGCDFYIDYNLIIYFNTGDEESILVEHSPGYWADPPYDEDDVDYKKKADAWYANHLIAKPNIIIYDNNGFLNPLCKTKYGFMIQDKLAKCNKNIGDIVKIIKTGYGYERN